MNKSELLENHTREKLADMIIEQKTGIEKLREQLKETKNEYVGVVWDYCDSVKREEYEKLKSELNRKENTINQIDDILNELFGISFKKLETKVQFEGFKECLKEKIKNNKTIADFLPTEPIKVADMLINAEGEYERNAIGKAFYGNDKGAYNLFNISELRQIAEHLLVCCNANESEE